MEAALLSCTTSAEEDNSTSEQLTHKMNMTMYTFISTFIINLSKIKMVKLLSSVLYRFSFLQMDSIKGVSQNNHPVSLTKIQTLLFSDLLSLTWTSFYLKLSWTKILGQISDVPDYSFSVFCSFLFFFHVIWVVKKAQLEFVFGVQGLQVSLGQHLDHSICAVAASWNQTANIDLSRKAKLLLWVNLMFLSTALVSTSWYSLLVPGFWP